MGRRNDPVWKHVDKLENNHFRCKFCKVEYAGGVSRIKSHLSDVEGRGIKICTKVPKNVRREATQAIGGPSRKRKFVSSSSDDDVSNSSESKSNEAGIQSNEERKRRAVENLEQEMGEVRTSSQAGEGNQGIEEERIQGLVQNLEEELGERQTSSHVRERNQERGEERMPMEVQSIEQEANFMENNNAEMQHFETRRNALLTTRLVGQEIQCSIHKVWSWLMKDDILRVGIYGIGGVGKTALMRHVRRVILSNSEIFHNVYWVTVSPGFGIQELQNVIAKTMHLDISKEVDEEKRIEKLLDVFIRNKKSVLILDNVWTYFPLEEVGIPITKDGCKLVLTTRSFDICRMMGCQNVIKVNPLSEEEGWNLFKEKLGDETELSEEVEKIAQSIARQIAGLPLGIIKMATRMRGVVNISAWRNALEELRGPRPLQDAMEVFQNLKLSYDYLNDSSLQQCFLYCALFPKDFEIKRIKLIKYLIVEGIIGERKSRQAEYDKGHSMLDKLENICLLEGFTYQNIRFVSMNDVVRKMALQILGINSLVMVEADKSLEELPDQEKWTEDLVTVSLMFNNIKEIPSSHSPRCPNLSTLLLLKSGLDIIANSFFEQLHGLTILDLSHTTIKELPASISDLENLIALLLEWCEELTLVPSLAKLSALKHLDLSHTGIEQVPEGIELLSKLKYLDLFDTELKELPDGMLTKFLRLQFFRLNWLGETSITIKAEEVACLRKLETLECHFNDLSDFNIYTRSLEDHRLSLTAWDIDKPQLSKYNLQVGICSENTDGESENKFNRNVYIYNCSIDRYGEDPILPKNIQMLKISSCTIERSLLCLENATELKSLGIWSCNGIECLLSSSSAYCALQRLETLELYDLDKLSVIFCREVPVAQPSTRTALSAVTSFSCLRTLIISHCPRLKKLFPHGFLSSLQNLEKIAVGFCSSMQELIAAEQQEEEIMVEENNRSSATATSIFHNAQFSFPKLTTLILKGLPNLKSICNGVMICNSLRELQSIDCMQLKRIPISLPLPSLETIKVHPREWWDSVEWIDPDTKNDLESLCQWNLPSFTP